MVGVSTGTHVKVPVLCSTVVSHCIHYLVSYLFYHRVGDPLVRAGKQHHPLPTVQERTVVFDSAAVEGSFSEPDPGHVTSVDEKLWRRDLQLQLDHLQQDVDNDDDDDDDDDEDGAASDNHEQVKPAHEGKKKKDIAVLKRSFNEQGVRDKDQQQIKRMASEQAPKVHHQLHAGIKQRGLHTAKLG